MYKCVDKNTHQMKYGGNAKHSEARKIWKIIFMLREVRLEFFWKNKFYFWGGEIIINCTQRPPNLEVRAEFLVPTQFFPAFILFFHHFY